MSTDRTHSPLALYRIAILVALGWMSIVTTTASEGSQLFAVDIRLRIDPSIRSRQIIDGLKSEAEAVWRPYGIRLWWRDAAARGAAASALTLEASLEREPEWRQRPSKPGVLGRVVVRPGRLNRPQIGVAFDAIEGVLAVRTTGRSTTNGIVLDRELALALGRVLAHEIGHVILNVSDHEREGLMRAAFPPIELAAPDRAPYRLTCGGADRLGIRLRALTGQSPRGESAPLALENLRPGRGSPDDGSCLDRRLAR